MEIIAAICAIISLSFASALNAFMALTMVCVVSHYLQVPLGWPLAGVTPQFIFTYLVPITLVELWINKFPRVIGYIFALQFVLRPLIALVLTVAVAGKSDWWFVLLMAAFQYLAVGYLFILRFVFRKSISATTHGIGVPIMSVLEDLLAAVTGIVALLTPFISLAFTMLSGYLLVRLYMHIRARQIARAYFASLEPIGVPASPMPPAVGDVPKEVQ